MIGPILWVRKMESEPLSSLMGPVEEKATHKNLSVCSSYLELV